MYDSYGNATLTTGNSHNNTRLYTGREYDVETWWYFNRARYYSPTLGRFISRDPIGIKDDVNLYSYTGNNPVNYTDRVGTIKAFLHVLRVIRAANRDVAKVWLSAVWAWIVIPWAQPAIPIGGLILLTSTWIDVTAWFTESFAESIKDKEIVPWPAEGAAIEGLVSYFWWKFIAKVYTWTNAAINSGWRFINPENWQYILNTIAKASISIDQGFWSIVWWIHEKVFPNY